MLSKYDSKMCIRINAFPVPDISIAQNQRVVIVNSYARLATFTIDVHLGSILNALVGWYDGLRGIVSLTPDRN